MNTDLYQKPSVVTEKVLNICQEFFGLQPKSLRELPGDRSQNFLVIDQKERKYVLKISSGFDHQEGLEFENMVLRLLSKEMPEYHFPQPQMSINNEDLVIYQHQNEIFMIRLFNYVDGQHLSELSEIPENLWKEVGKFLARIDRLLQNFYHPGQNRNLPWDIKNVLWSKERLNYVMEARLRRQLDYALLQYETQVWPQIQSFRKQVIYGDANQHNFILKRSAKGSWQLKGLIDFGDMTESYLICEPAIAITYVMMLSPEPEKIASLLLASYHAINPLKKEELEVLYYLVLARLVISLTMSAWRKQVEPSNVYMTISELPGWKLLDELLSSNPEKWRRLFFRACGLKPELRFLSDQKIMEWRHSHFSSALSLAYKKPLHIVRGYGQYLFDAEGRSYLDCVNNVCHVGHSHPEVARAVCRQMAILNTNTRYLYDQLMLYASKLLAKFPSRFKYVFLVNSGSEANALSLRLARSYTRGTEILVIDGAYHGNLTSLIDISPYKFDGPGGQGAPPYVHKIPTPDPYRGKYRGYSVEATEKYISEIEIILNKLRSENKKIIGLIAESMMSCAGQVIFPPEFLKKAFELVKSFGGVAIADEVQVGFGRPGNFFWGFESQKAQPDIVTLGKPIGNGHPIGAVIATEEVVKAFETGMEYFNTFGGNPVSCAAGLAVLEVIEKENLQENAQLVGYYFLQELKKLQKRHRLIGQVRGLGLFLGVELVSDRKTLQPATKEARIIIEKMKDKGILVSTDGPFRNVLKIKPPLVFDRNNVDRFVETLDMILKNFG